MTVVDFRSGGFERARDSHGRDDYDYDHDLRQSRDVRDQWDDSDADWQPAWTGGADAAAGRLTDRDSVLGRMARFTHYMGAVTSVGLMVGLGVWGYQLVVRDVSGVPVIRAVEGDARIAPDNPGGELTDRTGMAVNDVAAGVESRPAQQVAIAPAPTGLDGQDVAMGQLGATARAPDGVSDVSTLEDAAPAIALTDSQIAARTAAEAEAAATAAREADEAELAAANVPTVAPGEADAAPVDAAVTTADGARTQDTAINAALAEAGATPTVAAPTRPMPRPRRVALAAASPAPAAADAPTSSRTEASRAPAAETAPEAAPAAVAAVKPAAGAPLVQIGAFDSDAIAQSEFSRVSGRFGALFSGKAPIVQKHQANGRTFYRLRVAGFDSRDDARRFCAALIEAGTDCIPAAAK